MTAPAPSPYEQAEIDRFGIFDQEERDRDRLAAALFKVDTSSHLGLAGMSYEAAADALLPVVDLIAKEWAAAELRRVTREADELRAEVTRLVAANPARGSYDDGLKRGLGYAHDRIRAALAPQADQ